MTHHPSFIVWALGRWANEMWVRFGGHGVKVYLVGSALHSPNHKDIDVSIVLPDDFFRDRYGMLEPEWLKEQARMEEHKDAKGKVTGKTGAYRMNEWTPAQKRWAKEVGGLVPGLAHVLKGYGGCPDLKVVSETWQKTWHRAKPRIRLDNVEEDDA